MRTILFTLFINFCMNSFSYASVREIEIEVGRPYPLNFKEPTFLILTKKKILDVFARSESSYSLIPLKKGFVSIIARNEQTESRILVTVVSPQNKLKPKQPHKRRFIFKIETLYSKDHKLGEVGRVPNLRINSRDLRLGHQERTSLTGFQGEVEGVTEEPFRMAAGLGYIDSPRKDDLAVKAGLKGKFEVEYLETKKYKLTAQIKQNRLFPKEIQAFNSVYFLSANTPKKLATFFVQGQEDNQHETNGFAQIPILSIFFKLKQKLTSNMTIDFFATIVPLPD